jgi:hypothetical protein
MDAEKLIDELVTGPLGDLVRERFMQEILDDLRAEQRFHPDDTEETREEHRAWLREMADYLEENYL